MASGHVNRANRPNTWLHRPNAANVKNALANSEPSTHGTDRQFGHVRVDGGDRGDSGLDMLNARLSQDDPYTDIGSITKHDLPEATPRPARVSPCP
jgi:hypothetical protein